MQTYKWGFSFIQLFIMVLLLNIWGLGTFILYRKGSSRMNGTEVMPKYGAAIEFVSQLGQELGQPVGTLASKLEYDSRIVNRLKGGRIGPQPLPGLHCGNLGSPGKRDNFRTQHPKVGWRLWRHVIIAGQFSLYIMLLALIQTLSGRRDIYLTVGLVLMHFTFGVVSALMVGRSRRSKINIALLLSFFFGTPGPILIMVFAFPR